MATTSNFGWNTPDDTDLVKDGALAIRTLGNNIDTSLVDLKGGTTGQILSKNSNTDLDYTWINNDQGDITAVTAGTGISGGGTTGAVTITNDMATTITASGDIIVGTGSGTYDNLPIGTTGQVLTADTTVSPYKVKWAAAAASSPLTTKGDLYTYDTGNARLGVGANGETLVADSSTTTGLRWQADWNTGKNKIINGDFTINQRNFTSNTTDSSYNFDRWLQQNVDGTFTVTPQTFTPGAAPVAGYEATNFLRGVVASQTLATAYAIFTQRIEDVRTFAGQTITLSFWAKAGSGAPKIFTEVTQRFGTGGSPSSEVIVSGGQVTISTSWARYSVTISVPSISGKTVGTTANTSSLALNLWLSAGSNANARTGSLGIQNNTFDIWGVQVEAGSVATPFTTATGTIQGELAACQRYYWRNATGVAYGAQGQGAANSTTVAIIQIKNPVRMRVAPTSIDSSGNEISDFAGTATALTALAIRSNESNQDITVVDATVASGLTQHRPYYLRASNNTGAFFGANAEL